MRTRLFTCLALMTGLLLALPLPASAALVRTVASSDATPPVLTLPRARTIEATSSNGATVTFIASAVDQIDPNPAMVCTPPSGAVFVTGTTTVRCTATDATGNRATGSFTVTVTVTVPSTVTRSTVPPQVSHVPTGGVESGGGSTAGLRHNGMLTLGGILILCAGTGVLFRRRVAGEH